LNLEPEYRACWGRDSGPCDLPRKRRHNGRLRVGIGLALMPLIDLAHWLVIEPIAVVVRRNRTRRATAQPQAPPSRGLGLSIYRVIM